MFSTELFIISAVGIVCETVCLRVAPRLMSRLAILPVGVSMRLPTRGDPAEVLRALPATMKAADYLGGWDDPRSRAWLRAKLFFAPFCPFVARVVVASPAPAELAGYRQAADPTQYVEIRARWAPVPVSMYLFLAQLIVSVPDHSQVTQGGFSPAVGLLFFGGATLVVLILSYRRARAALTAVVNGVERALASSEATSAPEEL